MFREDYVMRLIRQLGEFLARVAGHRKKGDYVAALTEAGRAYDRLLEVPREIADRVDTPTLAALLVSADKIRVAAKIFWEEGNLYKASGDPLSAFARHRRALELFLEARALDPQEEDTSAILELSRQVPAAQLDPRYRDR
jgi:hypothetical protein